MLTIDEVKLIEPPFRVSYLINKYAEALKSGNGDDASRTIYLIEHCGIILRDDVARILRRGIELYEKSRVMEEGSKEWVAHMKNIQIMDRINKMKDRKPEFNRIDFLINKLQEVRDNKGNIECFILLDRKRCISVKDLEIMRRGGDDVAMIVVNN